MEPMRAPIKSKTASKKARIAKATASKSTKLKVTKPEEPAAKIAKKVWAGTQFGRSPIFIRKQSVIRDNNTRRTPAEQEDWLDRPGLDYETNTIDKDSITVKMSTPSAVQVKPMHQYIDIRRIMSDTSI